MFSSASPAGEPFEVPEVAEAAGMVDEVPDRDGMSEVGHLRHVLADIVIEGELTSVRQQRDARSRELLRDRPHVENGLRCERNVKFEIGHPVRAAIRNLSFAHDRAGTAGRIRLIPLLENLVHLGRDAHRRGRLFRFLSP